MLSRDGGAVQGGGMLSITVSDIITYRPVDRQMLPKILPCLKLRLRAGMTLRTLSMTLTT